MRLSITLAAALLLQSGPMQVDLISATPQQLRYERPIILPDASTGWACAVLDADVFAHAESRSTDDLRVFRSDSAQTDIEVPFVLAESEAQPDEVVSATPSNLRIRENKLDFELAMPQRAYSTVELKLAATNFDGIATVSGISRNGSSPTPLGSFPIFDRGTQQLGGSTALPMQESRFPTIHVTLELWKTTGEPLTGLPASIIEGATVPPSREAQTLYTTVAQTSKTEQRDHRTFAVLHVPAHVPVERIAFAVDAAFVGNFKRSVTVSARPDGTRDSTAIEAIGGAISTVHLPRRMGPEAVFRNMQMDDTLAATLRTGATLEVAVDDGANPPLPLQTVQAQMRQRTVCFHAEPGNTYMLRYGDALLTAPVYPAAASKTNDLRILTARLGAERINPAFTARVDARSYPGRHPELLWVVLIIALALMGAAAMHAARQTGRK